MKIHLLLFCLLGVFLSCEKKDEPDNGPMLKIQVQFDANQARLGNLGQPANAPAGNGTLTPDFKAMSLHFIEMTTSILTPYKGGYNLYAGAERAANNPNPYGFSTAIEFDEAIIMEENEVFLEIPIRDITPGTYKHLRASVTYQNYDVRYNLHNVPTVGTIPNQNGTIASFLGYNMYLSDVEVRESSLPVNDFKLQGFWAFETDLSAPWDAYNTAISGQAPDGATTVVNPFPDSPVPPGSCVVSGSFSEDLNITGTETEDITLSLSFSINNSFEWEDLNGNNEWDIDVENPANSEKVVDMGLRGLVGKVE